MKLLSFLMLKRQRKTLSPSFRSYKTSLRKKPSKPAIIKAKSISIPSGRQARRTSKKKRRFILALKGLLVLTVISSIGYGLFFTPFLNIEKIQIKGSPETLDEEAVLNEYFQSYLGNNLLLFPTFKHKTSLLEQFTYLQTLNISRKFPNTLTVILEPFPQVANVQVTNTDGSIAYYIINNQGYIASIGVSDDSLPTLVMDLSGIDEELDLNVQMVDPLTLTTLTEISKDFEGKFKINVLETHYLNRAREVHLYTERDFYVWIDLSQDADAQLAKLKKAMTKLNLYEANLEYIDLRISGQNGEKVIYKLKDEGL